MRLFKTQLTSLLILSFICFGIWRYEIEYHGWQGLIWLSYFHISVPVSFGLFLIWLNLCIRTKIRKKIFLNLSAILYGIAIYYCLKISLTYGFIGGPRALLYSMQMPEWKLFIYNISIFIIVPLIPIGAYFILRIFKLKPSIKYLILGIIIILVSTPASVFLLDAFNHKGSADYIHTLKSGFIIPFCIISLGTLIVGIKKK